MCVVSAIHFPPRTRNRVSFFSQPLLITHQLFTKTNLRHHRQTRDDRLVAVAVPHPPRLGADLEHTRAVPLLHALGAHHRERDAPLERQPQRPVIARIVARVRAETAPLSAIENDRTGCDGVTATSAAISAALISECSRR